MSAIDATEEGFWNAIAEAPQDEVTWLIFADYLEERSDPRGALLRERSYWPHINADCRDPVQMILGILDAKPSSSGKLLQAAAMIGAPLVPGLLERCRANSPHNVRAAKVLAQLPSDCLLSILSDVIDLMPPYAEVLVTALPRLGAAAVAVLPALLKAEADHAIDQQTFAKTIAGIGPDASSPAVLARLIDHFCEEKQTDPRGVIAEALAVVAPPSMESVLLRVMERDPARFRSLAWRLAPEKKPVPAPLKKALHSGEKRVRWAAAGALAQGAPAEALPHLLDALRHASTPLLEPVVAAMGGMNQKVPEALPLLRKLLSRPKLPFAECVARALLAHSSDKAIEDVERLREPNPLVRQRIILGVAHEVTKQQPGRYALVNALRDPDPEVRRAAGAYCSRVLFLTFADEAALLPLRQALADADPIVRAGAANAIRHLKWRAAPAEAELMGLLRQDSDVTVRRNAAYTLATMEHETQAIFAGLEAGLDDPNEEVRLRTPLRRHRRPGPHLPSPQDRGDDLCRGAEGPRRKGTLGRGRASQARRTVVECRTETGANDPEGHGRKAFAVLQFGEQEYWGQSPHHCYPISCVSTTSGTPMIGFGGV